MVPTNSVSFFSRMITLPNILQFKNSSAHMGSLSSISISAQSLALIILGFFFMIVPSLGLQMKFILVILAGDLLVAIQMTTSVPRSTGNSKSKASASTTIFWVTGTVYLSEERTNPGLIASKAVSSMSLICKSMLSPTTASLTFQLLIRISLMRHCVSSGRMISFSSFFITPPSTFPDKQCPLIFPYCDSNMLVIVILRGLSMGRGGISRLAINYRNDCSQTLLSAWNFLTFFGVILMALMALIGMKMIDYSLNPIFSRQFCNFCLMLINLYALHSILSILFIATMSL